MKLQNWLKEFARDSLALGSIPIFIIVVARTSLADNYKLIFEILFAGLLLFIFSFFIKSQNHLARGIILYIFLLLFYNDKRFTIFATFLLILIIASLIYLKYSKKQIINGILTGLISSGISYWIFNYIITTIQNY